METDRLCFLLGPGQEAFCPRIQATGATPVVLVPIPFEGDFFQPEWAVAAGEQLARARSLASPGTELCGVLPAGDFSIEPYGEIPFAQCVAHYSSAAGALARSGAGSVLIHRAKSLLQARAGVLGARSAGLPVYVSLEIQGEGEGLLGGGDILSAFITLQELGTAALGFYSSVAGVILDPLEQVAPYARIPLLAITRNLTGSLPQPETDRLFEIRTAGLKARGACWQSILEAGEDQTEAAARALVSAPPCAVSRVDYRELQEIWATTEEQVFYLDGNEEFSPPIPCLGDLAEDIIPMEHEGWDALCIQLQTPDDGYNISLNNANLTMLPADFLSDDEDALDSALFFYNGRAIVDSRSIIPPQRLEEIARRYGAVFI